MIFDYIYLLDRGYGNYLMAQGIPPMGLDGYEEHDQRVKFQEAIETEDLEDSYVYLFKSYTELDDDQAESYYRKACTYFPDNIDVRAAAVDHAGDLMEKLALCRSLIDELKETEEIKDAIKEDPGNLVLYAETATYCFLNAEYFRDLVMAGMEHKAYEVARYITESLDDADELMLQDDFFALYVQLGKKEDAKAIYDDIYDVDKVLCPLLMSVLHYKYHEMDEAGKYLDLAVENGEGVPNVLKECMEFYDSFEPDEKNIAERDVFDIGDDFSDNDVLYGFITEHDNLFAPVFGYFLWALDRLGIEE